MQTEDNTEVQVLDVVKQGIKIVYLFSRVGKNLKSKLNVCIELTPRIN